MNNVVAEFAQPAKSVSDYMANIVLNPTLDVSANCRIWVVLGYFTFATPDFLALIVNAAPVQYPVRLLWESDWVLEPSDLLCHREVRVLDHFSATKLGCGVRK